MRWFSDRTIPALVVMFCLGAAVVLWQQQLLHKRLIRSAAQAEAQRFAAALEAFRTLYTSEVVATAKNHGIEVTHDYDSPSKRGKAIPLPATLSMKLGNELGARLHGGSTRLYSKFPFPYPNRNGLSDQFARDAWDALNQNPNEAFQQFDDTENGLLLRYAIADRMRASCVDCHNKHVDSPKRDWREGDVRGVLEVMLPLDMATEQMSANQRESLLLLSGIGGIGLLGLVVVIGRLRRASQELEQRVIDRTTELQLTAQSLEREEAQSRTVIESSPSALIVANRAGNIVLLNRQAELLFGYSRDELIGRSIETLVPGSVRAGHVTLREQFFENPGTRAMGEGRLLYGVRKDSTEIPVEIGLTPIETDDGPAVLAAIIDQRERKRTEARLAQQSEELRVAKDTAVEASQAKSAFLANMSHEIRTPMNGIIGMSDLLSGTELQPEQHECLGMVRQSADALLTLINDILDFSKIEAGRLELEEIAFSLRNCIGFAGRTLSTQAAEKQLELVCRIAPEIPDRLHGDPGRLGQILVNLAGNAIKFTDAGEVLIDVEAETLSEDRLVLNVSVCDTGIGIPKEMQQTIFEAFSQADTSTTRRYGGTGLGLAITSQLVELMHGEIRIESEVGKGTTFRFTAEFGIEADQQRSRVSGLSSMEGAPVLVVDDNATNRRILQEILLNWKLSPILAASGPDGLRMMQESHDAGRPVRLVLLDCMMPDMDGFEVARRIRSELGVTDCTMIMISSGIRSGDADRCQQLGIARCMSKPIIQSELLDVIFAELDFGSASDPDAATQPQLLATAVPRRILIAEDSVVNQRVARGFLEQRGHQVEVVGDGQQALDILRTEEFDLVLMDVQMPVLDGFSATAAIRDGEQGTSRHLPIIAMTANAMKGDRERCLEAGMDDYVSKPIEYLELYRAVESVPATVLSGTQLDGHVTEVTDGDNDSGRSSANTVTVTTSDPQTPGMTDETSVIDWPVARANMPGGDDFLKEMVEILLAEAPNLYEQMSVGISEQDLSAVRRAAHKLKSCVGTMAATSLQQLAQQIETCAGDGQLDEIEPMFHQMGSLMDGLIAELRSFLADQQGEDENQA
jgi:PAS domain S-box-containing protein